MSKLNESPMQANHPHHGKPHQDIRQNIEQRGDNPFSKIDILHKGDENYKTIEKLSDEEFNDVTRTLEKHGKVVSPGEVGTMISKLMKTQSKHKKKLEQLAKNVVQKFFGVPQEVMDNIFVELKDDMYSIEFSVDKSREMEDDENDITPQPDIKQPQVNIDAPADFENPDDKNFDFQELVKGFTEEEKKIIKQNVDKRIISNALMMGAGFRAHNLLEKTKASLDAMDPNLYPAYATIMHNTVHHMWQIPPAKKVNFLNAPDKNQKQGEMPQNPGQPPAQPAEPQDDGGGDTRIVGGKSNLKLGEDTNGDGIREVEGAEAQAIIFPVLLHETVKAVIEYIFAHGLPQYSERINNAIMRKAEKFHFEHWHKLLGPRLWKYLHEAIDYIVKERGNDYTIVAYLLQEIAMLPPDKFLGLMDRVLHDGLKAIEWLEKMLDKVEIDMQNNDNEPPPAEDLNFDNLNQYMDKIQGMLKQNPEEVQQQNNLQNHKPFKEMTLEELQAYWEEALEAGEYELAAEASDEIERRG